MSEKNSFSQVPIEEQVEALVRRDLRGLRLQYAPGLSQDQGYKKILTLTRADVRRYLASKYKLDDFLNTEQGRADGYYAIQTSRGYHVYYQEQLIKMFEAEVDSEAEIWDQYTDYLLKTSGAGIYRRIEADERKVSKEDSEL